MTRQDPASPPFWETRYRDGVTPWDAGRVPAALGAFLVAERQPLRVLIPGCGSAYEARAFAEAGHDVLAIDFSEAAVALAQERLGRHAGVVRLTDFFAFELEAPFDVVYERAFLCALPPALWDRYAARAAEVLGPGGRLAGFFFGMRDVAPAEPARRHGPPFALYAGELEHLLTPAFERLADALVDDSIPVFAGRERWQVWQRRAPDPV